MLETSMDWRQRRSVMRRKKARPAELARKNRLCGERFGMLVVLRRYAGEYWDCRCDCGLEKTVQGSNLRSGATKSCGCQHHVITKAWRENISRAAKAKYSKMPAQERSASVRRAWVTRRANMPSLRKK